MIAYNIFSDSNWMLVAVQISICTPAVSKAAIAEMNKMEAETDHHKVNILSPCWAI